MNATNGEGDIQAEGIIFLKFIYENSRDIKEHSNNKVIINYYVFIPFALLRSL